MIGMNLLLTRSTIRASNSGFIKLVAVQPFHQCLTTVHHEFFGEGQGPQPLERARIQLERALWYLSSARMLAWTSSIGPSALTKW